MTSLAKLHRFAILQTTLSFILISISLIFVLKTPARGYELSIYSITPLILWVAIFFGLITGIFLLVICTFNMNRKLFVIGIFEIILCNSILISLWALRGYVLNMGRGDNASYIGFAKDIGIYGHVLKYNFYPHASILISQINQLTGIPVLEISKYITALFFVVFFLSMYCWAKSIKNDTNFIVFTLVASVPLFYAWFYATIYYMLLSTLLLPIFFYSMSKNNDLRYRIIAIIFCLMFPFFHPLTATFLFVYLISIYIVTKLYKDSEGCGEVSLTLVFILSISAVMWFMSQYILWKDISSVMLQLVGIVEEASTASQSQYYVNSLGYLTALKSFVLMAFDEIVYYLLSAVGIFLIIKNSKKRFYSISLCLIFGTLFVFILFLFSNSHTPDRLINLNVNMIFTPILIAYTISKLNSRNKFVLISLLIVLSLITTTLSLYQSPITSRPNDQFSISELSGIEWYISSKNADVPTTSIMSPPFRYSDLIYGRGYRSNIKNLRDNHIGFERHFGGLESKIFSSKNDMYLVITNYDIQSYTIVWTRTDRYNMEDFILLDSCKNVDKIYSNSGLFISYVHKTTE